MQCLIRPRRGDDYNWDIWRCSPPSVTLYDPIKNISLWQISEIQTCLCIVVDPGFDSTSPAFVSCASHPASPHGRPSHKMVDWAPNAGSTKGRHNLHCLAKVTPSILDVYLLEVCCYLCVAEVCCYLYVAECGGIYK